MSRARQLRIESLKQELEKLEKDYKTVDKKKIRESNPQERNNLELQLHAIANDMEEIEQQLKELEHLEEKEPTHPLLQLLTPFENKIFKSLQRVYKSCSPEDWLNPVPDTLKGILDELKKMPQGSSNYTKLEQFIAYLVVDSETPQSMFQSLKAWGEQNMKGFSELLNEVKQAERIKSLGGDPYLMVVIRRSEQNSVSKVNPENHYFVDAWLIPNYETQGVSVCKQLAKPESLQETITLDEIPGLLKFFLEQSAKYLSSKLTIEVFLPLNLMNQAVDAWEIDDELGLPITLGSQCNIVVRSYERSLPTYLYKGFWEEKWRVLEQLSQSSASSIFAVGDCDKLRELFIELSKENIIGLKLATVPIQTGKGSIFALILKTATPVAIWLRKNLALNCEEEIESLLNCCIYKLPENVKMKRLDALPTPPDTHIGQHLSLLWENPYRLPPSIDYSM